MTEDKFHGRLAYVVTGFSMDDDAIGVPAMAFTDEEFADYMATKLGGKSYEVLLIETSPSEMSYEQKLELASVMTGGRSQGG